MMGVEGAASLDYNAVLRRRDVCALQSARRVAAMLDQDPDTIEDGATLPRGWHFFLLGGDTQRSRLRGDGFPGFGVPMPDLGLPRLLLGGRTVNYQGDIQIGDNIERVSKISRFERRESASSPSAIVTLHHELRPTALERPAVIETQTYILLPEAKARDTDRDPRTSEQLRLRDGKCVTPDETLLFQYSALGFNSHKIHIDRDHARKVEGFPDLVVNGGLTMLLATELLRNDLGVSPLRIKSRHTAPLFCGRPISFITRRTGQVVELEALDEAGTTAMQLVLDVA
ncbi:hypothetical protein [Bosea sp. (in: a-proteobacteria)]|uniref:hypothetical protein n=1 Tax=Bosea sp. (in: a-proteobacteria) TaxID=1871050 RepID=UPI0040345BDD